MSLPCPKRVASRFAGAIMLYDQDDNPANSEIKQPGPDVNYRAEGPTTFAIEPDDRSGEPTGQHEPNNQTDNVPPASSRVIPDQMKNTLQDQLTYKAAFLPEAPDGLGEYEDVRVEPEGGEGSQVPGADKEAKAALITRLTRGTVLYHGTPYGKKFVHPRGPAWFTPDRDITENYLDQPWSPRAEAWSQKIEKNPRRLKFRLKREVKLPWIGPPFGAGKGDVLAGYAADLFPFPEAVLAEAIEDLGTSSGTSWDWAKEDIDSSRFGSDEVRAAVRVLTEFKDIVELMQFLCKNTDFEGWIQRYARGGTEVALCDPKSLLRPAASQVPRGPKLNRREKLKLIREQLQKEKDRDAYRKKMEAERLREEVEREKKEDLQYKVYLSVTNQAEPGELDYSDPELRRALNNWTDYVHPRMVGYATDSWDDVSARTYPIRRTAALISEIMSNCGPEIVDRSKVIKYKRKRRSPSGMSTWVAQSVDSPKEYIIKVKPIRKGNVKAWSKMPVQVSCTCPYFRWQGPEHWAKTNRYLYGKPVGTASKPVIKDPKGKHWACKHVYAVLRLAQKWRFASSEVPYELVPMPDPVRVATRYLDRLTSLQYWIG